MKEKGVTHTHIHKYIYSEVWGAFFTFTDNEPYESLHIKFLKNILGVHSKSSNSACRYELNRFPLKEKIMYRVIKYLSHITENKNSLLYEIFRETEATNKWTISVKTFLDQLGFSYLSSNLELLNKKTPTCEKRIHDVECYQVLS